MLLLLLGVTGLLPFSKVKLDKSNTSLSVNKLIVLYMSTYRHLYALKILRSSNCVILGPVCRFNCVLKFWLHVATFNSRPNYCITFVTARNIYLFIF